jgi:ABC-type methionine transport system permease subunit
MTVKERQSINDAAMIIETREGGEGPLLINLIFFVQFLYLDSQHYINNQQSLYTILNIVYSTLHTISFQFILLFLLPLQGHYPIVG